MRLESDSQVLLVVDNQGPDVVDRASKNTSKPPREGLLRFLEPPQPPCKGQIQGTMEEATYDIFSFTQVK